MNKKGDIPVMILVIGVFAICTLAILSFGFIDNKSKKGFVESIEAMEEMNSDIQKYYFYQNLNFEESKINEFLDLNKGYIEVEKKIEGKMIIKIKYNILD